MASPAKHPGRFTAVDTDSQPDARTLRGPALLLVGGVCCFLFAIFDFPLMQLDLPVGRGVVRTGSEEAHAPFVSDAADESIDPQGTADQSIGPPLVMPLDAMSPSLPPPPPSPLPAAPPSPTAQPAAPLAALPVRSPSPLWPQHAATNCVSGGDSFAASDLEGSLVASPTECKRECLDRPQCEGFTHHSGSNECVFKRDLIVSQCVRNNGNFTLFKRPGLVPLSLKWQAFAGISCWGEGEGAIDLDAPGSPSAGVGTVDECLRLCVSTAGCEAVQIVRQKRQAAFACYRKRDLHLRQCFDDDDSEIFISTRLDKSWPKTVSRVARLGRGAGGSRLVTRPLAGYSRAHRKVHSRTEPSLAKRLHFAGARRQQS